MQSNAGRLAIVAAAIAAVVVLFIVLSEEGSDEPSPTPVAPPERDAQSGKSEPRGKGIEEATDAGKQEIPTIVVEGGQPAGGVQELEFTAGDRVAFEVDSDVAEEVHVHGYDVIVDVEPGKPERFDFTADIEGVFEVELEESAVQIAELTVNPE